MPPAAPTTQTFMLRSLQLTTVLVGSSGCQVVARWVVCRRVRLSSGTGGSKQGRYVMHSCAPRVLAT